MRRFRAVGLAGGITLGAAPMRPEQTGTGRQWPKKNPSGPGRNNGQIRPCLASPRVRGWGEWMSWRQRLSPFAHAPLLIAIALALVFFAQWLYTSSSDGSFRRSLASPLVLQLALIVVGGALVEGLLKSLSAMRAKNEEDASQETRAASQNAVGPRSRRPCTATDQGGESRRDLHRPDAEAHTRHPRPRGDWGGCQSNLRTLYGQR
jgi:hypothetical protein